MDTTASATNAGRLRTSSSRCCAASCSASASACDRFLGGGSRGGVLAGSAGMDASAPSSRRTWAACLRGDQRAPMRADLRAQCSATYRKPSGSPSRPHSSTRRRSLSPAVMPCARPAMLWGHPPTRGGTVPPTTLDHSPEGHPTSYDEARLWRVELGRVELVGSTWGRSINGSATPCHAAPRSATPCHAAPRSATPCHAALFSSRVYPPDKSKREASRNPVAPRSARLGHAAHYALILRIGAK
jgi:hypothetical protein